MLLLALVIATHLVRPSLQDPKDPLTDFCRRFGHQTAVIGRRLFINGGLVDWNPISQNPFNYTNSWFLYNDLDVNNQGLPQLYPNLSINATVPAVSGGTLWADTVNEVLYQFAGEFQGPPQPSTLWTYDAVYNVWNQSNIPDEINRVSWGAGVTVDLRAEGYYLGGWLSNLTMEGWSGPPIATSNMIIYNMISQTFTNNTGPDSTGRAEGAMVFIPASDNGLLIYFGGVLDPFRNGSLVGSAMNTIYVYDINSEKWYQQQASGDIPDMRRRFCAGATWSQDQSSYNIYLYGGLGIPPNNNTGFDDVYILTIPSFTWIKWWPTLSNITARPHHSMTCNVINNSQMLIIGGTFPADQNCDSPNVYGTHNLNLGADGPEDSQWDYFFSNITTYQVPQQIIAQIGGGPSGGANVVKPQSGFDNPDLEVYFTRIPRFTSRTATRFIPTATGRSNSKSGMTSEQRTGAIVGSVVGGCVVLIVLIALVLCLLSRRKKRRRTGTSTRPAELPATANPPIASDAVTEEQKAQLHAQHQQISQGNLPSPGSTNSTVYTSHASPARGTSPNGYEPTSGTTFVTPSPFSHQPSRSDLFPSPTSQHSQGVYPLGPYYQAQELQASAGAQMQPHYPQYAPPKGSLRGQLQPSAYEERLAGFPIYRSEFSEADEDKRRSMTKTPAEMYPPPLSITNSQERRDRPEHTTAPNIGVVRSTRAD